CDIVLKTAENIRDKVFLSENLTVTVAVLLSFAIGRFVEGVIAILLLQLSYLVRDYALFKTREMLCRAVEPQRKMLSGLEAGGKGDPEYPVGSTLVAYEGMELPVDCVIKEGSGFADLSFITGSSKKVPLSKGDYVPAGSVCVGGQFLAEAAQPPEDALYKKMGSLLKTGYGEVTANEIAWGKWTSFFVPAALIISLILLLVLPFIFKIDFTETVRRITIIIAIASPCGVLLSIPMTYFSSMAAGRSSGVLFTHAAALDKTAEVKAIVFKKLGTLTDRNYLVTEIKTDKMDQATFLKVAAYAAVKSKNHLAKAIINAFGEEIDKTLVEKFAEFPDKGISVSIQGIKILLGSSEFLSENGANVPSGDAEAGAKLFMSVSGSYAGYITLNETIKPDVSASYFKTLAKTGADRIVMVSGDSRDRDSLVARELGLDEYYAECPTEEKILRIAEIKERIDKKSALAFVGDCESGEKLFEAADVGILTDGVACAGELSKADVVIMENGIGPLPSAIMLAQKTKHSVARGSAFVCFIKAVILVLAVLGYAPLWFALLIDFSAALAAVLSSTGIYTRESKR
ncbi:MAG: HAD-IC family P-type ATPase, partial [Oscillospiraceae bacterium]|nr:HAD-IC family P-type ATPase [Oscillospiraceae bacterium]